MVEIDHLSITYTFPPFLSDLILKALDGASGPRQRRYRQAEGAAGWGIKTIRPPMALILAGQGKIGGG